MVENKNATLDWEPGLILVIAALAATPIFWVTRRRILSWVRSDEHAEEKDVNVVVKKPRHKKEHRTPFSKRYSVLLTDEERQHFLSKKSL